MPELKDKYPEGQAVLDGELEGCILCADCLDVLPLMPDGCVDMIFTDPPYLREHVHLYGKLSAIASSVVKDGGFVYAYCGAEFLPDEIAGMVSSLTWFWLFNIKHRGGAPRLWHKRIMVTSKPVLVCTNGSTNQNDLRWMACDCEIERKEKVGHKWGQSVGFPLQQIEMRTIPSDIILDPFVGSGTTCIAAKKLGRRWIGIDISPEYVKIARNRLKNTPRPLFTNENQLTIERKRNAQ